MKVCHINLARGFRGGERQTEILIDALRRQGVQQQVIVRAGETFEQRLARAVDLLVSPVRKPFVLRNPVQPSCDVIHAHEGKAAHLALIASWRTGVPYIITRRVPERPHGDAFTRLVYRRAAGIAALSQAIRDVLLDFDAGLPVAVIPSMTSDLAVDRAAVDALRARYRGKFVVGLIGALVSRHKGQPHLIEAARALRATHPDIHVLLIGSGADESALRALAGDCTNVEFTGFVSNVGDYLAALDVMILPSLHEGLGSILLDALQLGTPIIATTVGGIVDVIRDGENGLLIPPADAQAIRAAIIRMHDDAELRARLVAAGRRGLERYQPDHVAAQYLELYRSVATPATRNR